MSDATLTDSRDAPAMLVLAPGLSGDDARVCTQRVAAADAALVVSLRRPPEDWRAARDGALPPTCFVTAEPNGDAANAVADPGDLTGLGIAVSERLGDLPEDAEPAVCVDSLTTLLQYADTERAYRFLQVLCGRVRAAGGTVHVHADPAAHDERELDRLAGLFDGVRSVEN
ncbi:uncharacterized protein HHUB_3675 [Halobacterium hubeiense]|jgi:hypothetical protein|uniref:Uncharacterized protein n=1 Tax=Halobacterium hubeiense TaxID=1407499 RepID=A0A0U5D145_9EURY|nr:hypothetical protein [Halobacterium hubeiense]CQH62195.1 uncharacterized protein HHUB_3675 [Halobacterium hubeiense]